MNNFLCNTRDDKTPSRSRLQVSVATTQSDEQLGGERRQGMGIFRFIYDAFEVTLRFYYMLSARPFFPLLPASCCSIHYNVESQKVNEKERESPKSQMKKD